MCARGELDLRVPRGVGALLDAAVRAAREAAGYWLSPGECIARIAEHFVGTWEKALAGKPRASGASRPPKVQWPRAPTRAMSLRTDSLGGIS
ncbi:MAG: hypothetical protein A2V77_09910 [Anaeromyxobacter sp. RBG_16_69_14]|nr:MAG: hypothetical protein A2V77_09910 [Anaeromyxobacter sp. RBG_16_69_14]